MSTAVGFLASQKKVSLRDLREKNTDRLLASPKRHSCIYYNTSVICKSSRYDNLCCFKKTFSLFVVMRFLMIIPISTTYKTQCQIFKRLA